MPTAAKRNTPTNQLLARLPASARTHFLAHCESVELKLGQALFDTGDRLRHVYFPTTSFISMLVPTEGTASLEVGMVGFEGVVGLSVMLGVDESNVRGLVQGAGSSWRITSAGFRDEVARSPALRKILDKYLYVLMGQLAQSAACTRFHLVEARLARWLLMTRDRARADEFSITHEFLAYMLGVRRAGVTKAAGALQARRVIHYGRGKVTVLNVRGLEAIACTCYGAGKHMYESVLNP